MIKVARATFNLQKFVHVDMQIFYHRKSRFTKKKNRPTTLHVKNIGDPLITQEGSGAQI